MTSNSGVNTTDQDDYVGNSTSHAKIQNNRPGFWPFGRNFSTHTYWIDTGYGISIFCDQNQSADTSPPLPRGRMCRAHFVCNSINKYEYNRIEIVIYIHCVNYVIRSRPSLQVPHPVEKRLAF